MPRVLVTGAAGFVAGHLAARFAGAGHEPVLADLVPPRPQPGMPDLSGYRFVALDVTDREAVAAALAELRPDGVAHAAGIVGPAASREDPGRTVAVNVIGTQHVLDAARATGARVTLLSTATIYGNDPSLRPLRETDPVDPVSLYDASKLMAETLLTAYKRTYGLAGCSVRFGFPYGPGQKIDQYFLPRAADGQPIRETAGADHPSDFTYIDDLTAGLVGAHTVANPRDVYNVTGGVLRTRGDFARAVMAAVPAADIELGPGPQPGRHLRGACDIGRAGEDFGYRPAFTVETGVLDWARRIGVA
ncbi:NAD-dependent epimerase/dehydratase family protein [Dactylosporangium sp. CA-092794]|uniref:NAD-dependent epimerase/dehydratase family protein n=1 Tax=Dactylosporangium sp. CA-092794 TaxID=3239929 RepID=UPI003D9445DD